MNTKSVMKISLYFAQSLIMEKSPVCRVIRHPWNGKRSRKASVGGSRKSPVLTREGGKDLGHLLLNTAETSHVYTDTKILNRLTGEYHIIANETTYDWLITTSNSNKKRVYATIRSSISW